MIGCRAFVAALVVAGDARHDLLQGRIRELVRLGDKLLGSLSPQDGSQAVPVKDRHFTVLPDLKIEAQIIVCVDGQHAVSMTPDERTCSYVLIDQNESRHFARMRLFSGPCWIWQALARVYASAAEWALPHCRRAQDAARSLSVFPARSSLSNVTNWLTVRMPAFW